MRRHLVFFIAAAAVLTLASEAPGQGDEPAKTDRKQKFIYVPYEDLDKALKTPSGIKHGVVLEFEEYMRLLGRVRKKEQEKPPVSLSVPIIHSSSYSGVVGEEQVKFTGRLTFTSMAKGFTRLSLPFGAVGITSARLDGKPAKIILSEGGYALLLSPRHAGSAHRLELSFAVPLKREKRGKSLGLRIPPAPSATVTLKMPGKAHVTVSPDLYSSSYSEENDTTTVLIHAGGKDFVLAHMAAEERKTNLEPFVTSETELLIRLAPRTVTVHGSLTARAYRQKISSLKVSIPKAYRITELRCKELLGWTDEESGALKLLTLNFRQPVDSATVTLTLEKELPEDGRVDISPIQIPGALTDRPLMQIITSGEVSFEVVSVENLNEVTPRTPRVADVKGRPVKAFVGWPLSWSLALKVSRITPLVRSLLTALVTIERTKLSLNFLCTFEVKEGGLYSCSLTMPAQWEILSVATGLAPDEYDYTVSPAGQENVVEVFLKRRLKPPAVLPVSVSARLIPNRADWEELPIAVPRVAPRNVKLRLGTIVFRGEDAMTLSGEDIVGLTDLDVSQIKHRGITARKTTLGYEVKKENYSGTVVARMKKPRVSATCVTYLAVNESLFQAVSLLTMRFDERPTSEFQFVLPKGTGDMLDIRGDFIKEKSLQKRPDGDYWKISLQKEVIGEYPLYIANEVKIGKDASELTAPKILVPGPVRHDGFIGVEAGEGIEILTESENLREIPVSSLPRPSSLVRYYVPRRPVIHAFRYIGTDYSLKLKVTKRPLAPVLTTVLPRASYRTVYSPDGVERTRALFELTSVGGQFFTFRLPEGAKLWSVLLGRTPAGLSPVKPARRGEMIMVPLTGAPPPQKGRESIYFIAATYERLHEPMAGSGTVRLSLPVLEADLPVLQSHLRTYLPPRYRYTPSGDEMRLATREYRQPVFLEYMWSYLMVVFAVLTGLAVLLGLRPRAQNRARLLSILAIVTVIAVLTVFYISVEPQYPPNISVIARSQGAPSAISWFEAPRGGFLWPPDMEGEKSEEKEPPAIVTRREFDQGPDIPRGTSFDRSRSPEEKAGEEPERPPADQAAPLVTGEKVPAARRLTAVTELADDIRMARERQRGLLSLAINLRPEGTPLAFYSLSRGGVVSIDYVSRTRAFAGCVGLTLLAFLVAVFLRKRSLRVKLIYVLASAAIFSFVPSIVGPQRTIYCNAALFGIVSGIIFLTVAALAKRYRKALGAVAILLALLLCAIAPEAAMAGGGVKPVSKTPQEKAGPKQPQPRQNTPRKLPGQKPPRKKTPEPDVVIVPYDPKDLTKVPGKGRVHVAVERYEELLRSAGLLPEDPPESPRLFSVSSASYAATILAEAAEFSLEMGLELLRREAAEIFIGFPGIALADAKLGDKDARLRSTASGYYLILTEPGPHKFRARFRLPLDPKKVRGSVEFPVRPIPCALLTVRTKRADTDVVVRSAIGGQEVKETEDGKQVIAALGAASVISISYGPPPSRPVGASQATDARLSHYYWVSESLILVRCDAHLTISGEGKSAFSFKLPRGLDVYQVVSPKEIRQVRILRQDEGANRLEVLLYEPVKGQLSLTVNGAYVLKHKTGDISLPFLETLGARKETGRVSVFLSNTLKCHITRSKNLFQVSSSPKTRDHYELYSSYEYSTRPIEMSLTTVEKRPDLRANIYTQLAVMRDKLLLKTVAQLKVDQAPVFDVSLRIRGDFDIEEVSCPHMSSKHIKEDGQQKLITIHLSRGFQGSTSVTLTGSREVADNLTELDLPHVAIPASRFAKGFIVVSSTEGIALTTKATKNLVPVDVRTVPYPSGAALAQGTKQLAFAWQAQDHSGTIGVERPRPTLNAHCVTSALVRDEVVSFTTIIKYEIKSAPCRRFSFSMPYSLSQKAVLTAPFERQRILKRQGEGENARAIWTIELQRELTDSYHLAINWEEIARHRKTFTIPCIIPADVESSRAYVMVQNRSGLKVTERQKKNLDPAGRENIPLLGALQLKRAIFLGGYKVQDPRKDYSYSFSIERLEEEKDIEAIIDIAEITTVINREGHTFNEVSYRIQNRTKQYLQVQLPRGAQLWSAEVDGKLVKPALPPGGADGIIFLPLLKRGKGELSYSVKVFYSLKLDSKPGFGSTISLKPPNPLDINVGQTFWTVFAPGEFEYTSRGNMEEVIESVREVEKVTSYAQEAQRLVRELEETASIEQRELIAGNLEQFNELMQEQLRRAEQGQEKLAGQTELMTGKFMEQYHKNIEKLKQAQLELAGNIRRVQEEKAKLAQQAAKQRAKKEAGFVAPQAEQAGQAGEFLQKAQKRVREQIAREEKARKDISAMDRLSNKNLDSTSCIDAYGIGGGRAGAYGQRWGKGSLAREGGSPGTESAVTASLRWLHFHQDPDGKWDNDGFDRNCNRRQGTVCDGRGFGQYDVAVTGIALLAFLGHGHTHRVGLFKKTVKRGLDWLVRQQRPDGSFGPRLVDSWIYNHAIATNAICEAYAVSRDYRLKEPAQRAVDFIRNAQNPGLGWKYKPQDGRNDTSVTGWMVMALKAAKTAGLHVEQSVFDSAVNWFDRATNTAGKTGYMRPGDNGSVIRGVNENYAKLPTMTAVAVLCRIFCGQSRRDPKILKGVDILMANLPQWNKPANTKVDFYYWYYATYAMFQYGGRKWHKWNNAMKRALLENQRVGGCADGSWDPVGKWGRVGGRVYATALNSLTLEIYYRYARAHPGRHTPRDDWDKAGVSEKRVVEHGARAEGFMPPQIQLPKTGMTLSFKKLGADPVLVLRSTDTQAFARIYAFLRLLSFLLLLAVAFLFRLSFFGERSLPRQAGESVMFGIAALFCILTVWVALPVICACVVVLVLAKTRRLEVAG